MTNTGRVPLLDRSFFLQQKYSSAFAFGLLEAGFTRGDKLVLFTDQGASAESIVSQMGAIKAGVTVVTFDEKENLDALDHVLGQGAKGLIFSPDTAAQGGETRLSFLQKLIPELKTMMRGDELRSGKYPTLSMLVQTGFNGVRGVNKFKDVAIYTAASMSSRQIPANEGSAVTHLTFRGGREISSITSEELVQKSNSLWEQHLSQTSGDTNPIFMSADLETPFGFAAFLGCTTHFKKVFVPGSFKMTEILKHVPRQQSSFLVCDEEFFEVAVPEAKAEDYREMVSGVKGALVGGSSTGSARSGLFSAA